MKFSMIISDRASNSDSVVKDSLPLRRQYLGKKLKEK